MVLQASERAEGETTWYRIDAAFAERVTAEDPAEGHKSAAKEAEASESGSCVGGAARDEATGRGRLQRGEEALIEADGANEEELTDIFSVHDFLGGWNWEVSLRR